jgi:site-specific recombinase XerD
MQLQTPSTGRRTWDDAVGAFLRDARARNCSSATLTGYIGYLTGPRARQFVEDYRIRSVADVTPDRLRSFQAELLDAGLSAGTAGTFHRVFRNFLGFCARQGYGVPPESLDLPAPLEPVTAPETFSDAEERQLLDACRCDRDKLLVQFMIRTGLRRSEVVSVRIDDIIEGADGAYLRVRQGKGRKDRIVPLDTAHEKFSRKLVRYVRTGRPKDTSDLHLWLSTRKSPRTGDYMPLSVEALKSLLQRLSQTTGIHTHPHKFRHTFASRALAAGVDSLVLQRALGHTTLAMVNRYVHFQSADLVRAWQARSD